MARVLVPRERVAEILNRVLPEYDGVLEVETNTTLGRVKHEDVHVGNMASAIARSTGQKQMSVHRRLRAILNDLGPLENGKRQEGNPTFETVDKILSGLGLSHLWHTDEVLRPIYEALA